MEMLIASFVILAGLLIYVRHYKTKEKDSH